MATPERTHTFEPQGLDRTTDHSAPVVTLVEPVGPVTPGGYGTAQGDPLAADRADTVPSSAAPPGYAVERELGRGGMGVVYLARQLGLNRPAAVKMLLDDNPKAVIRFLAESEAVASVRHPNVVEVYQFGEHAGRPFLALEFCPGGSLADRPHGPDAPADAAALMAAIAAGVGAAHAIGVIHRDLKPGNVLFDAADTPKVADFGLAKLGAGADLTRTQAVMGTPAYMSPEQASGGTKFVGPSADVWALGVMLYERLTGQRPFKGADAWELMAAVVQSAFVPPHKVHPGVPADLDLICRKCLEREQHRRYPTAGELAADLNNWRAGRPITARRAGWLETAAMWGRRNPAGAAAAAAVLVAVASLGAGGLAYAGYERQRANGLRQELDRVRRTEQARDGYRQAVADGRRLRDAGRPAEARTAYARGLAVLGTTPEAADDGEVVRAELAAVERQVAAQETASARRADLTEFRRLRDEAVYHETLFTGTDPAANRQASRAAADRALALIGLDRDPADPVSVTARLGDPFSAAERAELVAGGFDLLLLAAALADRAGDPAVAAAVLSRADTLPAAGAPRAVPARLATYARKAGDATAATAAEAEAGRRPADHPADLFAAALDGYQRGDPVDAAAAAERLLVRRPDHFWGRYLLAVCRLREGKFAEAAAGLTAGLAARPDFALCRALRGFARLELGDHPSAEADSDAVLAGGPDPLARFIALSNLGLLRDRQGRPTEAVAAFAAAAAARPDLPQGYASLARAQEVGGDRAAAAATLDAAVAKFPTQIGLRLDRGQLRDRTGDPAAGDDFRAVAEAGSPAQAATAHLELARLAQRADDLPAALAAVEQALDRQPRGVDAARLRASLLVAAGRSADADQALTAFLGWAGPAAQPRDHALLGAVRLQRRDHPGAVDALTVALAQRLAPEVRRGVRLDRGAAYLAMGAPRLALADYAAVLLDAPTDKDALAGRAGCWVELGQFREARADLTALEQLPDPAARHLAVAARGHAALFNALDTDYGRQRRAGLTAAQVADSFTAGVRLLGAALTSRPAADRRAFWDTYVAPDPAFRPLLATPAFRKLATTLPPAPADRP